MTQENGKTPYMELISTTVCKTREIGVHNNMYGGYIMSLVDDAAACYACQVCDSASMVTIKLNELVFKNPIKVGDILKSYGCVSEFGKTSVTLYIEFRRHSVHTGQQEVVLFTTIKFVRIDNNGKAIPILEHVKSRYAERVKKYGKGLLSAEELEKENNGKT